MSSQHFLLTRNITKKIEIWGINKILVSVCMDVGPIRWLIMVKDPSDISLFAVVSCPFKTTY